jgi:hypothetical protein
MADITLRPRSATELVDATFQVFRREPLQFIVAVGIAYLPFLIIVPLVGSAALSAAGVSIAANQAAWSARNVGLSALVAVLAVVTYIFSAGTTTMLASDVYLGHAPDLGRAFVVTARRAPRLVGAIIVSGILMMVPFVPFALAGVLGSAASVIAFVLLCIVEAWIYATLIALRPAILLENVSIVRAISRSRQLSDGLRRHILASVVLVLLINLAFAIGASVASSFLGSQLLKAVLQFVVGVLVYPLVGIVQTLVYYDLRIRREGFDIEHLASSLDPSLGTT